MADKSPATPRPPPPSPAVVPRRDDRDVGQRASAPAPAAAPPQQVSVLMRHALSMMHWFS